MARAMVLYMSMLFSAEQVGGCLVALTQLHWIDPPVQSDASMQAHDSVSDGVWKANEQRPIWILLSTTFKGPNLRRNVSTYTNKHATKACSVLTPSTPGQGRAQTSPDARAPLHASRMDDVSDTGPRSAQHGPRLCRDNTTRLKSIRL